MFKILLLFFFSFQLWAIDCQSPDASKDPIFYNLCTKSCETDQDCQIVEHGCDSFPVNKKYKDGFSDFIKSFPENKCSSNNNYKPCLQPKCFKKSCIIDKIECKKETSNPGIVSTPPTIIQTSTSFRSQAGIPNQQSTTIMSNLNTLIETLSSEPKINSEKTFKNNCSQNITKMKTIGPVDKTNFNSRSLENYFTENPNDHYCNLYIAFSLKNFLDPSATQQLLNNSLKKIEVKDLPSLVDTLVQGIAGNTVYFNSNNALFLNYNLEENTDKKVYIFAIQMLLDQSFNNFIPREDTKDQALFFYKNILITSHPILSIMEKMGAARKYASIYLMLDSEKKINLTTDIVSGKLNEFNFSKTLQSIYPLAIVNIIKDNLNPVISSKNISTNLKCRYLGLIKSFYKDIYSKDLKEKLTAASNLSDICAIDFKSLNDLIKEKKIKDCSAYLYPATAAFIPESPNNSLSFYNPVKNGICLEKCEQDNDCTNLTQKPCLIFAGNSKYAPEYSKFFEKNNPSHSCILYSGHEETYRCEKNKCILNSFTSKEDITKYFESVLANVKSNNKLNDCQNNFQCSVYRFDYMLADRKNISILLGMNSSVESIKVNEELRSNIRDKAAVNVYYNNDSMIPKNAICAKNSCAWLEIKD